MSYCSPRCLRHSASVTPPLALIMFGACLLYVWLFAFHLCLFFVCCVVFVAPDGYRSCIFFRCVYAVWLNFLPSFLLCQISLDLSTGDIIGRIVWSNINLIPSGFSLRPQRIQYKNEFRIYIYLVCNYHLHFCHELTNFLSMNGFNLWIRKQTVQSIVWVPGYRPNRHMDTVVLRSTRFHHSPTS